MSQLPAPVLDEELLHSTIKLNTILSAAISGGLASFVFGLVTAVALFSHKEAFTGFLNILGCLFPGYRVSIGGIFIGLFWAMVYGAILGGSLYQLYAAGIRREVEERLASGMVNAESLNHVVVRISGHRLGLASGIVASIALVIATNYVAAFGETAEINSAQLLSNYLYGYTTSFSGSLMGAVQILVLVYGLSNLFALVYNGVAGHSRRLAAK